MYANKFSVRIPEGNEIPDGYVEMKHGQTYSLILKNDRQVACDAIVQIDGQHVGTWRLNAGNHSRIERPADKPRLFTFYALDSQESQEAGLVDSDDLGLVSVQFVPAKLPKRQLLERITRSMESDYSPSKGSPAAFNSRGTDRSAGGTGLSGHSSQQFTEVAALDYDYDQAYTINLRLVAVTSAPKIEPLTVRSTPIPPKVG